MSTDSCLAFFERTTREPHFGRMLRSATDTRELIALGRKHGYTFDVADIAAASSAIAAREPAAPGAVSNPGVVSNPGAVSNPGVAARPAPDTTILHHEFDLRGLPAFGPVLAELPNLTISPPTVDLDLFRACFRRDDLEWTSMSPRAPGFRRRYEEVMAPHWTADADHEFARRDFHLVNLDRHIDHPRYDRYFAAKTRVIAALEQIFGAEIQFSGSMWYPPFSYRLWHTNEDQPGWRMYLIDLDCASEGSPFFRYLNPHTGELVTLRDRPAMVRFFKVEQRPDRLFWHCIVNGTERNRWSFGFVVPETWMSAMQARV